MSGNDERVIDYFECDCNPDGIYGDGQYWEARDKNANILFYVNSEEYVRGSDLGLINLDRDVDFDISLDEALDSVVVFTCHTCPRSVAYHSRNGKFIRQYIEENWDARSYGE